MKKMTRYMITVCIIFIMASAIFPSRVMAAPLGMSYAKRLGYGLTKKQVNAGAHFNMGLTKKMLGGGKITKVTSSNKKMIKQIKLYRGYFQFVVKKYGKTTFTITVKKSKNTTQKYKCNFTSAKYSNPVSSVKIGSGSNLAGEFNKDITCHKYRTVKYGNNLVSEKIAVKPKNGWKVNSIVYSYYDQMKKKSIQKNIKNNSAIKYYYFSSAIDGTEFKNSNGTVQICLKNKKTAVEQTLFIYSYITCETAPDSMDIPTEN